MEQLQVQIYNKISISETEFNVQFSCLNDGLIGVITFGNDYLKTTSDEDLISDAKINIYNSLTDEQKLNYEI